MNNFQFNARERQHICRNRYVIQQGNMFCIASGDNEVQAIEDANRCQERMNTGFIFGNSASVIQVQDDDQARQIVKDRTGAEECINLEEII